MNINGHEVERRDDGSLYVDGEYSGWGGDLDSGAYEHEARIYDAKAIAARLVAEFVRREQAEKAEQDAAGELDRRALLACNAWHGTTDIAYTGTFHADQWRRVVRVLDADATERAT